MRQCPICGYEPVIQTIISDKMAEDWGHQTVFKCVDCGFWEPVIEPNPYLLQLLEERGFIEL